MPCLIIGDFSIKLKFQDSGRILAIGGSRKPPMSPIYPYITPVHSFKVLKVPKLVKKTGEDFQTFQMDIEYAKFAVGALQTLPKR
jgi:hypothetical protein